MFDELVKSIPTNYISQISDYVKIILSIISTYLVTRYTLNSPRQRDIMQKQFELVYLPLYKLTHQYKTIDILNKNQIYEFNKHLIKILQKHYEYVIPQLHNLSLKLMEQLNAEKRYEETFSNIIYHIDFDYERLKRKLGYPSNNSLQMFKRFRTKDKWVVFLALMMLLISPFIITGIAFVITQHDFSMLLCSTLAFISIWILSKELS